MEELGLSIMLRDPDPAGDLQLLLDQFGAQHHIHVRVNSLPWETAWAELVKVALYGDGPDVSEIGTTWTGSFVAMNALRPFGLNEISVMGGPSTFIPSSWQTCSLPGDRQTWAVPWLADMRIIYYRRDLLEQVGIDEQTAFQASQDMAHTLRRLQTGGIAVPWVVPTGCSANTLHNVASWVWGAGGDFVTADGRRTLINQPETRAGIRAYFELGRHHMAADARGLDINQSDRLFWQGQAAVTISGPWMLLIGLRQSVTPQVAANVGVALTPGVTFVGGSNLVVWKHTHYAEAAVELIRFLTSQQVQTAYNPRAGLLPIRLDALDGLSSAGDALYRVLVQGLKTGRSFPSLLMWGLIEAKLVVALFDLWEDVLTDPSLDLDVAISKQLDPIARKLDLMLGQGS